MNADLNFMDDIQGATKTSIGAIKIYQDEELDTNDTLFKLSQWAKIFH